PNQQQKAVADVVTSGNPIFEGLYADPEWIIYGDNYWVFPTWSDAYEKQNYFDCFSSKVFVFWTKHSSVLDTSAVKWA
ncbi:arabinan endo-1,5-alpha-L-arabinosidase, partial [Parabacteroides merdae]|nr:arabinan endo-1,5-alpha-L-arabinosidase [Parabacteroides merdae]